MAPTAPAKRSRANHDRPAHRGGGLFPRETEVARRLSQTPAEWAAKAAILERAGFPKVDPIMGGRFWPAVEAFWRRRYGVDNIESSGAYHQPDGRENLDVL